MALNFYIQWQSAAVLRYSTTNFKLLYATWAKTQPHKSGTTTCRTGQGLLRRL